MSDHPPCQATPPGDLRNQIMSSLVPKNEREHWAARHIEELERENAGLRWLISKVNQSAWDDLKAENAKVRELGHAFADFIEAIVKNATAHGEGIEALSDMSTAVALYTANSLPFLAADLCAVILVSKRRAFVIPMYDFPDVKSSL